MIIKLAEGVLQEGVTIIPNAEDVVDAMFVV